MRILLITILLLTKISLASAQVLFPDKCIGVWKGTMMIYSRGTLRDSVRVTLTIAKDEKPNQWIWRTEYHSEKLPMTKDYVLKLKDVEKQIYITDEKNGIELLSYHFSNKLYDTFETQGVYLTSSYELRGNELIFEVTSGKKGELTGSEVTNYSIDNVQRVILRKSN